MKEEVFMNLAGDLFIVKWFDNGNHPMYADMDRRARMLLEVAGAISLGEL